MKCDNCDKEHNGNYGSGRFCSQKCAKGFSTKNNREEISRKTSITLGGDGEIKRKLICINCGKEFKRKKGKYCSLNCQHKYIKKISIKKLHNGELKKHSTIRPIILEEQGNRCAICKNKPIWEGKPIIYDVDHIDGNPANRGRNNLQVICPNCHRQTKTFAGGNIGSNNSKTVRSYMKKYPNYRQRQNVLLLNN